LSNRTVAALLAIVCTLLWGSAYPFIKLGYALFNVAPEDTGAKIAFGGVRFALAGIIVLLFYYLKGNHKREEVLSTPLWAQMFLLGLVQTTIHYFFFYVGLSFTTGAKSSILNSTSVFFSALLAHLFYANDKLTLKKSIGIVSGFLAIVLVNLEVNFEFSLSFRGEGFVIIATFLTSVSVLYSKRLSKSVDPVFLSGVQLTFGGVLLFLISLLLGASFPKSSLWGYFLLLYLALLSAVAFSLWTSLLKHNRVSSVTVFYFLIPIFGTLLSGLVLKEDIFQLQYYLALPVVAVGIYLVNSESK